MDEKELRSRITLRPKAEFSLSAWEGQVRLTGTFQAGTTYWVQVAEGVRDSYGNRMGAASATVAMPAYTPTLGLLEKGTYLEPHGTLAVPLYCVNVPEARVVVSRLPGMPWEFEGDVLSDVALSGNSEPNEMSTHGIALPGTGHYRVEASAPDLGLQEVRYYQVTDLAITFKLGRSRSLACVTSFESARPKADVDLELYDEEGRLLYMGMTDGEGRLWLPGRPMVDRRPRYLVARTDGDWASIDLRRTEIESWRLPVRARDPEEEVELEVFLFTERPIYRPGETARAKGWWKGAKGETIRLELRDGRHDLKESVVCRLSPTGGFDASFRLGDHAPSGSYEIAAVVGARKSAHDFQVGSYRAPSFEVKVQPSRPYAFPKDKLEATVEGRAYFGAPLAGAAIHWYAWVEGAGEEARGEGVLDREGRFRIAYRLGLKPGELVINATVTDAAHQSVSSQASLRIRPAEYEVVAKAKEWLVEAGRPLEIVYAVKSAEGTPADREVAVRLVRRSWSHVQQRTAGHGWSYTWEKHDDLVAAGFADGGRWIGVPQEPGSHVVEMRVMDDAGRESLASVEVDVVGPGEGAWYPRNDLTVALVPDRERYRVGDTARVLVKNAPAGSRALVTLEREGVNESRWIEVPTGAPVIEVPIRAEHLPNIHMGIVLLRGRTGDDRGPDGEDRGRPCFRFGYATLEVDASGERLPVEVTTVRDALPGSEVTVEIATAPRAEVALAVVDQAVLALLDGQDPDPHAFFAASRPLRVEMSEARPGLAVRRALDVRGKKGRPGGDGGPDKEGRSLRKDFRGTAYWNPRVEADGQGRAVVRFKLPDNLTRWRVVAVAATPGRWGTGHATFEARKPLMIASGLPRFACLGDSFEARFVVHNRSGSAGKARVELDGAAHEVDIADGAAKPVVFPVRARSLGPWRFTVVGRLGAHEDRLEVTVPVRYPAATESKLLTGRIHKSGTVSLPSFANVESVELVLGKSPLVPLEGRLRHLLDYPHGCVEQTTSKTIPLLACRDLGIEGTDERIRAGVARLLSMQTPGGGLAYWPGERDPHPAGSVYAAHALVIARREGFEVPAPAVEGLLKYVEGMLREGVGAWQTYALYVLALAGRRHEAYLQSLERDPFLALAAIEMGKSEQARRILGRLSKAPANDLFQSEVRTRCAAAMAKGRLGEDPGVSARALAEEATRTYERAWTLLAAREISGGPEAKARYVKVFVDDRLLSVWPLEGIVRLSVPAGRLRFETDGSFWYSVLVKGQQPEGRAEDRGFWIRRSYTRAGESTPRLDFKAGDLVVVRVTAAASRSRSYVALEDPLPAGFEPVDLSFRTEARYDAHGDWFSYVERRDDRIFASLQEMSGGARELVTLARATTAGTFAAPAPRAEEMYGPDVWGRGPSSTVTIR